MYKNLTIEEQKKLLSAEQERYSSYKAMNLSLDMSRGKPCKEQLDISMDMFDKITSTTDFKRKIDYRNYGIADGIPELKKLFGDLLGGISSNEIIVAIKNNEN